MFGSNPNEYDLKNELATCCYGLGAVYLAKHVPSHEYVAVKKFKMDKAKEESNLIMVSNFCAVIDYRIKCIVEWHHFRPIRPPTFVAYWNLTSSAIKQPIKIIFKLDYDVFTWTD